LRRDSSFASLDEGALKRFGSSRCGALRDSDLHPVVVIGIPQYANEHKAGSNVYDFAATNSQYVDGKKIMDFLCHCRDFGKPNDRGLILGKQFFCSATVKNVSTFMAIVYFTTALYRW